MPLIKEPTWIWIQAIFDPNQKNYMYILYDIKSPHLDLERGHFGPRSKELPHHMICMVPHLDLNTGYFGSKSKELSSYDIHSPHLDLDTGHFGSRSTELHYHMVI